MVDAMTPKQLAAVIAEWGMTKKRAAEFFGLSERQLLRILASPGPIDRRTELLLRSMKISGLTPHDLDRRF